MWYIHTIEYYSSIQKNGVLTCATTETDFEVIKLSEANNKGPLIVSFCLCETSRRNKSIKTESRLVIARS